MNSKSRYFCREADWFGRDSPQAKSKGDAYPDVDGRSVQGRRGEFPGKRCFECSTVEHCIRAFDQHNAFHITASRHPNFDKNFAFSAVSEGLRRVCRLNPSQHNRFGVIIDQFFRRTVDIERVGCYPGFRVSCQVLKPIDYLCGIVRRRASEEFNEKSETKNF